MAMLKSLSFIAVSLSLSAPLVAQADETGSSISIGYATSSANGNEDMFSYDADLSGINVELERFWTKNVYTTFEYTGLEGDMVVNAFGMRLAVPMELDHFDGIIGYRHGLNAQSSVDIGVGLKAESASIVGDSESQSAFLLAPRYNYAFNDKFSATAGIDFFDDQTAIVLKGAYQFHPRFSIEVGYKDYDQGAITNINLAFR